MPLSLAATQRASGRCLSVAMLSTYRVGAWTAQGKRGLTGSVPAGIFLVAMTTEICGWIRLRPEVESALLEAVH